MKEIPPKPIKNKINLRNRLLKNFKKRPNAEKKFTVKNFTYNKPNDKTCLNDWSTDDNDPNGQ